MNILITNGYFYKLDPKQWKTAQPYPPLGTLIAASVARAFSPTVEFFDNSLMDGPGPILAHLHKTKPQVVIVWDDGFNYLTKMCLTVMREAVLEITRTANAVGSTVLVCSSDSSDHYATYIGQGAHIVVRGEGEQTLEELLPLLSHQQSYNHVRGIAFMNEGTIQVNPAREIIRNLDDLPLPSWDLLDVEPYRTVWNNHVGYFSLNMATTRGCPYKCNWCAKPIYGNRYNARSPEAVVNEIAMLVDRYKVDHFWMSDDIFGLKPGWVGTFANEVKRRGLHFRYKIQSRADLLVREKTAEALAASGADSVWLGAESGSQKILDAMDKGITIAQIEEATHKLKSLGLRVGFFIQFGYPGETFADIEKTIQLILRLMPDELGVSVSYPLPGTLFYENVKTELKTKQNWTDSDDLALMFRNTYQPAFYKVLHRYLHARFRVQRGLLLLRGKWNYRRMADIPRLLVSMLYHAPASIIHRWQLNSLQ